ncbi:MAG: shikimate kinase [Paracoccaceae bacterium]|jgi:shikimate kinase
MSAQINTTKDPTKIISPDKSIVLVGLMGAGKTCIGTRLARKLGMGFVDADDEIETAADCTIEEIFTRYGEQAFRDGERRVIARLLEEEPRVVATGGGAFVNQDTRDNVRRMGISVWLKADIDVLLHRVSRRNNRPLLKNGDKRQTLERLIEERYPTYGEADLTVESGTESPDITVSKVIDALRTIDDLRPEEAAAE